MTNLISTIIRFLWTSGSIKVGVDWLQPHGSDDKKIPFETAMVTSAGFLVASLLLRAMLPWNPLFFAGGAVIYFMVYFWVFAKKFELGFFKTVVFWLFQKLTNLVLLLILAVLPFGEVSVFREIWRFLIF